jgi:hypothetical protein
VPRPEGEGRFDAGEASALLVAAGAHAERQLEFRSPWLTVVAAVVVLVGFGDAWLSVLGQHPYRGPSPFALAILYALVLLRIVTVAVAHGRAKSGVSGRSVRQERAEGVALVVVLAAVYAVMAALAADGASNGIVYGVYVLTATLLVLGSFWAARSAVMEDRPGLCLSLALVVVAAASAFAGPYEVWLSDGIGCCVVLLGYSAFQAARRNRVRAAT